MTESWREGVLNKCPFRKQQEQMKSKDSWILGVGEETGLSLSPLGGVFRLSFELYSRAQLLMDGCLSLRKIYSGVPK